MQQMSKTTTDSYRAVTAQEQTTDLLQQYRLFIVRISERSTNIATTKLHVVARKCGKEDRNESIPCQLLLINTVLLSRKLSFSRIA